MHATSFLESAAALAAVLLLIVGLGRVAGRLRLPYFGSAQAGTAARLSVRTSLAIDPKRRLLIMACDGREGLLLLGPDGDVMLGWLDGTVGPNP